MPTNKLKTLEEYTLRDINKLVYIILLGFMILLQGCADKPKVAYNAVRFNDVVMPIQCNVDIPNKPLYIPDDLHSAKDLAEYYETVELLLKECASDRTHRKDK